MPPMISTKGYVSFFEYALAILIATKHASPPDFENLAIPPTYVSLKIIC